MTDLSTPPPIQDSETVALEKHSPWVMLISMALLICGLLLASAMLFHYGLKGQAGTENGDGFDLSVLIVKSQEFMTKSQDEASDTMPDKALSDPSAKSTGVRTFFSTSNDGSVKWPKLKLTGFGKSVDAEGGFAIINGKNILVGNQIGDVTLTEIRTHGVVVELKGETRILSVEVIK